MIELTHTDHKNISRIRLLLRLKSKCDNSDNKIIIFLGSLIERKIKKIDETYFKPRIREIYRKKNILRISTLHKKNRHYMLFQSLLQRC